MSKIDRYRHVKNGAEYFLDVLKSYPDKGDAEYTRLVEDLQIFISAGYFGEDDE